MIGKRRLARLAARSALRSFIAGARLATPVRTSGQRFASSCGIVGLPNVGKSLFFNACTQSEAAASENFPFCTIKAQTAGVPVLDQRLIALGRMAKSERIVPSAVEITDIAGLIKGASSGQGLGNAFLADVRGCGVLVHLVRCFEDSDVIHVDAQDGLNPANDIQVINSELVLADLQSVEKRLEALRGKKAKAASSKQSGQVSPQSTLACLEAVKPLLEDGFPARNLELGGAIPSGHEAAWAQLGLITQKPVLYVLNVDEEALLERGNRLTEIARRAIEEEAVASMQLLLRASGGDGSQANDAAEHAQAAPTDVLMVCAKLEAELAQLGSGEEGAQARQEYLAELGLEAEKEGLPEVVRRCQRLLGTINYYTQGPTESRAWPIKKGTGAKDAASEIHSDISEGFIRADVIAWDRLLECGSEAAAKKQGLVRSEGANYEVRDGDVIVFHHR